MIKYVVVYYNKVFQSHYEIECSSESEALDRVEDLKFLVEIVDIKIEKRELIYP